MKYYHQVDRYLRRQFRERTILLFYIGVFMVTLMALGTAFIYINIMTLQAGVNLGLPIYYTVFATLLLMRGISFRYLPSLVDAAVLRRRLRIDALLLAAMVLIGVALHLYIVERYALLDGIDLPFNVLVAECVASVLLIAVSVLHLSSIFFSDRWTRTEIELSPTAETEA